MARAQAVPLHISAFLDRPHITLVARIMANQSSQLVRTHEVPLACTSLESLTGTALPVDHAAAVNRTTPMCMSGALNLDIVLCA